MSWTFGGLAVHKNYSDNYEQLMIDMGLRRQNSGTEFPVEMAISSFNMGSAVRALGEYTILFDHYLPYDCSYVPGEFTQFDNRLIHFSNQSDVLVFLLDGISETYGFSIFQNGQLTRRWATGPGNISCDEGDLLNAELPFNNDDSAVIPNFLSTIGESRVIKVMEQFLSQSFGSLLKDQDHLFHLYT